MFPAQKLDREVLVEQRFLYEQPDNASPKSPLQFGPAELPDEAAQQLRHTIGIQTAERDVEERTIIVKAALEHDRVEVRIEPQHVAVGLMGDDHSRHQWASCRLPVELAYECENEPRYRGEQPAIMPEERSQCLWNREHELAVRKIKEHVVGEVLGEQERPLLTTRRTQVESFAAKRSECSLQNAAGRSAGRNRLRFLQCPQSGFVHLIRATPWR